MACENPTKTAMHYRQAIRDYESEPHSRSESPNERNTPVFAFSLRAPVIGLFIMGAGLFSIAVGGTLLLPYGYIGATLPLIMGLFFFYGFFRYWRIRVQSARFYDTHFVVSGRRFSDDFTYGDIMRVETLESTSFWTPQRHTRIFLGDSPSPIVLTQNPYSKRLGVDLGKWLGMKIGVRGDFVV